MAAAQKTKRSKACKANRPTHVKYWASNRLCHRKVKNMMEHNGMTRAEALAVWDKRKHRKH